MTANTVPPMTSSAATADPMISAVFFLDAARRARPRYAGCGPGRARVRRLRRQAVTGLGAPYGPCCCGACCGYP
ncbi:hypothetical protein ACFQ3Z_20135 [Streptomyces nogalater]